MLAADSSLPALSIPQPRGLTFGDPPEMASYRARHARDIAAAQAQQPAQDAQGDADLRAALLDVWQTLHALQGRVMAAAHGLGPDTVAGRPRSLRLLGTALRASAHMLSAASEVVLRRYPEQVPLTEVVQGFISNPQNMAWQLRNLADVRAAGCGVRHGCVIRL